MNFTNHLFLAAVWVLLSLSSAHAAEIVRDAGLISSMPIQGVTLAMTPQAAFDHLSTQGYRAGSITTYEEWTTGGLSMVLGTYGSPEGHSEITLSRTRSGRLVNISETYNRPGGGIDSNGEIQAMRNHFNIPVDDPQCQVNDHGSGSCRVADAAENANHAYGLSAFPAMIMRYATRNHELKNSY